MKKNICIITFVLSSFMVLMAQESNQNLSSFNYSSSIEVKKKPKLNDSPYAIFGDNTTVLKTDHEQKKKHSLKIPIIENSIERGVFELDFETGIVSILNLEKETRIRKKLSIEELARFTTMDPMSEKYYSISPYAYVANNPLKFTDPTGRWIQYSDSTGNYRYNNGGWEHYQNSGPDIGKYTAFTPAAGSFLDGVLIGLNALNNNVTGNNLLDFFANDTNDVFLKSGVNNTADISNSALGIITLSSTFQGSLMPTERGLQMSPFWLDIGHELSHRQDALKNGSAQAGATWLTQPDGTIIKATEKYATNMENLMRADAGLPLRTHYATQYTGGVVTGGWEPSRILNSGTRKSTFYGTTYRLAPRIVIPKGILP